MKTSSHAHHPPNAIQARGLRWQDSEVHVPVPASEHWVDLDSSEPRDQAATPPLLRVHILEPRLLSRARAVAPAPSKTYPFHFEMERIGFSKAYIERTGPDDHPLRDKIAEVDVATPQATHCRRHRAESPMPDKTAITIQLNGAEYLELLARAGESGMTPPAFVLVRCGAETWREDAACGRSAPPPRGRAVRLALERRSVTIRLPDQRREQLLGEARQAGTTLVQFIRTLCGFQVRNTSLPGTDERGDEEDDAWERLKRLGLKPEDYFPADD